jgi:hypothetical protein
MSKKIILKSIMSKRLGFLNCLSTPPKSCPLPMIFLLILITKMSSNPIKAAHSGRGHDFGGVE